MNLRVDVRGKFPRCTEVHTVVLHDRSGRVHHVHQALVFESKAAPATPGFIEAVARKAASRRGAPADLLALHLEGPVTGTGPHRVDVARGVLVRGS
jgi:hypothetical protein